MSEHDAPEHYVAMQRDDSVPGTIAMTVLVTDAGMLNPEVIAHVGQLCGDSFTRRLSEMYCEEHGHTFDDKRPNAETLCTVCHHFIGAVPA